MKFTIHNIINFSAINNFNRDIFAMKKRPTSGAAFHFIITEVIYATGATSLKPLPCMFTISIFVSSFRYFLNLAMYTSILRPLK